MVKNTGSLKHLCQRVYKLINIALDYDGTISADLDLFLELIKVMKKGGNDVRIVTYRGNNLELAAFNKEIIDFSNRAGVPVIFTSAMQKKTFCRDYYDWVPDIFIDDQPEFCPTSEELDTRCENILEFGE